MRLDRAGEFIDVDTHVGDFAFEDANGAHLGSVATTGQFWRAIELSYSGPALTPKAARQLARLLLRGADRADAESKRLGWKVGGGQ